MFCGKSAAKKDRIHDLCWWKGVKTINKQIGRCCQVKCDFCRSLLFSDIECSHPIPFTDSRSEFNFQDCASKQSCPREQKVVNTSNTQHKSLLADGKLCCSCGRESTQLLRNNYYLLYWLLMILHLSSIRRLTLAMSVKINNILISPKFTILVICFSIITKQVVSFKCEKSLHSSK